MDRNEQLLEKMQEINNNFNVKNNKYYTATTESLENKLEIVKKKIQVGIQKNKHQLTGILKDAGELYEKVDKNNKEYEQQAKIQIQRLRAIQDKFTKRIEVEILQRKQRQDSIITAFQERAQALRKQIEKQKKIRESLFIQVTNTLQDDLPSLMAQLHEAKQQFQAEQEETMANCEGLLQESEKYVKQFTAEQEANSNKAFELIKDLTKKIKTQIEQQKIACEATHEEVFAYVQQTCNKLAQR